MADNNKNILITPATGTTSQPTIEFSGYDVNSENITLSVLDDGTLSIEGSSGQLFSIADSLEGTIFSVNDVSGIPSIEVDDDGTIRLAEFTGNVLIGTDIDDGTNKVQIEGNLSSSGTITASTFSGDLSGNAATATKLATARTISLTGDSTGSASFDGSGNISIAVTRNTSNMLTDMLAVDGSGSGLDADLLDGNHASAFALASHSHSYLPLSGGTLTGALAANAGISHGGFTILNGSDTWLRTNGQTGWYSDTYGGGWYMTDSTYVRTYNGKGVYVSGTLVEASDERFKENIVPLKNSLDKVLALEGVSYNKIETPDRTEIGFIAQQVEAVVPEIVDTDETEEAYKSVSYSRTVALLVEAMKEQDERIKKLESIIETLKA